MLDIIALLAIIGAIIVLWILSLIDLRIRILPNELVAGFATLGAVFHLTTLCRYLPPDQIAIGAISGFGILYIIRYAANYYYQQDALGLGDVKLMGAAGIWLGLEGILFALTIGAFAGIIHGIGYAVYIAWKDKTPFTIERLAIPAGPGFAVGIVISGALLFQDFIGDQLNGFFS